ncbi:polyprenyl synthetase family protein [Nocardioides sp. HDW12B]|uniref:polyprenyl synthetase family protein n=1 Tax=Nocardioides sp. HDW12B TaxID=2714939 RepID=UPI0019814884|nr:polyprenyl synthetase family protein [Nocardioides sp. HDW12B]
MTSATPWDPASFRAEIQTVLDTFVDAQAAQYVDLGDDAARLMAAATQSVAGGKRFRAMFCAWGFRAVREPEPGEEGALLRAAAALELLHASALVHDDFMDASDTRRGHPATHVAFAELHRSSGWPGSPEQYGAAAAVLLGDLLLSWADELMRGCGLPADVVAEALRVFDATRSEVVLGQFLDVSLQARGEADVEQAMQVVRYKSAKYSVERPLHVGAVLAGGGPEMVGALSAFGLPLGEAFQLRDDLLGVFGDPSVTGKPAGDDLTEGKRTVLVALALAGSSVEDAAALDAALGRALEPAEVARFQGVIESSGAAAQVEERIDALTRDCLAALEAAPVTSYARVVLADLARAATQRSL